jgi:sugar phosphate isomerase/epimerase
MIETQSTGTGRVVGQGQIVDPSSNDRVDLPLSRRQALVMLAVASASPGALFAAESSGDRGDAPAAPEPALRDKPFLGLESRHLQWTSPEHGIDVAKDAGFPAILWSVRRGAHIEPGQVEADLPRIVRLTKAAGIETPAIVTSINDVTSDHAEAILATMQQLGIRFFRAAPPRYDYNAPFPPQYDALKKRLAGVANLCEKYNTTSAWHTMSYSNSIGGSAWDLWMWMRDLDPRYTGLDYDIGHITAKGGAGWRESIRAVGPYLHTVSVKDFYWVKQLGVPAGQWPWRCRFVRPGDGMVDFADFFRYLQAIRFPGAIGTYYEYSVKIPGTNKMLNMLGTAYKKWKLEIPEKTYIGYLKRDVDFYNQKWLEAMKSPPAPPFSVKAGEYIRYEGEGCV